MSPATETTDATKTLVLRLAREIEQLADGDTPAEEFFRRFLEKLVAAVAAPAAAVWLVEQGRLQLCCDLRLKTTGLLDTPEVQQFHQRLLAEVAANGEARAVHTDDESGVTFPRRHLMIVAAIRAGGRCRGVVEIIQRPDVPAAARAGYLQFVEQMTGFASLYFERRQAAAPAAVPARIEEELARLGLQLQRSLNLTEVAAVAANDGRLFVGCDRICVIVRRGKKYQLIAASGQDAVHHRANLVKAMIRLAREVIPSSVPVKYDGSMDNFPPQVKEPLGDLIHESNARLVYAVPLREPIPLVAPEAQESRPPEPGRAFGCLILEQFQQSEPSRRLVERLDWLTSYTAAAMHNALQYQSVFLMPLWSRLGRAREWLRGRRLIKSLLLLSGVALILGILVYVPVDFRIEANGRLMPEVRRQIFVPSDGEVVEVLVASGARVQAGQLLVRLRNTELQSEIIATESQREEKRKQQSALLAERDEAIRTPSSERSNRIDGELAKANAELQSLERRLRILAERSQRLNVTSPIDGVVSTFEVDQLLKYRPVRRGEVLLEVMDDTGPWQLELAVDEHRTGHLFRARQEHTDPLAVEYLLLTDPERTHQARLKDVGTRIVTSEDNVPVVEVLAALTEDQAVSPRIGAEVRARVYCGRKSLGYAMFGDLIEFIQKYLWL